MNTQDSGITTIQSGIALLATHHKTLTTNEEALDAFCIDLCDALTSGIDEVTPDDMGEHAAWKQEILLRFAKQLLTEQFNAGNLELLRQHIVEM